MVCRGEDPNTQNNMGWTILCLAVANGNYAISKYLIEKGANPNIVNALGRSPICYAARHGHLKIVRLLLKNNADPNMYEYPEDKGPLYVAIENNHVEVVKILSSISKLKEDESGNCREMELCIKMKNQEMIEIISKELRSRGVSFSFFKSI